MTPLELASRKRALAKTALFLVVTVLLFVGVAWHTLVRLNPEFRRSLVLDLKSPEIAKAIDFYKRQGVPVGAITQKQLNDYVVAHR